MHKIAYNCIKLSTFCIKLSTFMQSYPHFVHILHKVMHIMCEYRDVAYCFIERSEIVARSA
jgi:hypothetical protein